MPFQKGNQLWRKSKGNKGKEGWSKGLTKETNSSLAKQSLSLSKHWKKVGHPKGMKDKNHSDETKFKMSLAKTGQRNSNWKGGITRLIRGIRRSPEYYQWRKKVLSRDKFVCVRCGSDKKINSHHIRSIFDYPAGIFEANNGVALCENCHRMTDSYGKKRKGRNGENSYRLGR